MDRGRSTISVLQRLYPLVWILKSGQNTLIVRKIEANGQECIIDGWLFSQVKRLGYPMPQSLEPSILPSCRFYLCKSSGFVTSVGNCRRNIRVF